MIRIQDLSFSYNQAENILNHLSITVNQNSLLAVLGVNGAGKTTLFRCLTKVLHVPSNRIFVDGCDINTISYKRYAQIVSYVPQISSIRKDSCLVRDFLAEGRTPYLQPCTIPGECEYEYVEKVATQFHIEILLDYSLYQLSGGQLQLVSLARALIQDTPIIILDEPMSALDLCHQAVVLQEIQKLKQTGKTIIFSTHNPDHSLLLDSDVLLLHNGAVLEYGNARTSLSRQNIQRIYGNNVDLINNERGIEHIVLNLES